MFFVLSFLPLFAAFFLHNNGIFKSSLTMKMDPSDKNICTKLLYHNLAIAQECKFTSIDVDEEYNFKDTLEKTGVWKNYFFQSKDFRKIRFTHVDIESKVQYFSMLLHPHYHYDVPIFNFELIAYYKKNAVYTMNMVKMNNTGEYNKRYVMPFMNSKKSYPELKENMAVRLSNYSIFGNHISEAIMLGKFSEKHKSNMYENVVFPSFVEYLSIYLELIQNTRAIEEDALIHEIMQRHKLFDMKKAFIESQYEIRKFFDDKWYNSIVYNMFYETNIDE